MAFPQEDKGAIGRNPKREEIILQGIAGNGSRICPRLSFVTRALDIQIVVAGAARDSYEPIIPVASFLKIPRRTSFGPANRLGPIDQIRRAAVPDGEPPASGQW